MSPDDAPDTGQFFITIDEAEKHSVMLSPPSILTINGSDGARLVTIKPDGSLEYGPDYAPDEAAQLFWEAMRHYLPASCPQCGGDLLAAS